MTERNKNTNYRFYNCELTTLSPVHIGSGDSFSTLEYFFDESTNRICFVDQKKLMYAIKNYAKDSKHFNMIITSLVKDVETNIDNKRLNYGMNQFISEQLNINPEEVVGDSIPCSSLGKHKVNIEEFINYGGKRYIPGSSIKGSITTAFMYKRINDNERLIDNLIEHIHNVHWKERRPDEKIYKSVFGRDPKYNIFRAIQISDTESIGDREVRKIASFNYQFGPVLSTIFLETVYNAKKVIPFTMKIDDKLVYSKTLNLNEDLMRLIIESCNEHTIAKINFNINQINMIEDRTSISLSKIKKFYTGVLKITESLQDQNRIITQIGQGSGFYGTTINLILLEKAPEALMELRRKFRIGKSKKEDIYDQRFPKTNLIELSKDNQANNPLGWVMISFNE